MNLTDIFKNGLKYPTNNWVNLIILGVILLIITLIGQARAYTNNGIIIGVIAIISVILGIIVSGYKIDIIKKGVEGSDEIPLLSPENFITGIKSIIVSIVYYIIPAIIIIIVGFLTGAIAGIGELGKYFNAEVISAISTNPNLINQTIAQVPPSLFTNLFTAAAITAIIAAILFFIFSILAFIAQGKLAETDSLSAAISFGDILNKVGSIGWAKIIAYLILLFIILLVIGFISALICIIPIIGVIIAGLIISPFILLFQYYSLGLLYASDE